MHDLQFVEHHHDAECQAGIKNSHYVYDIISRTIDRKRKHCAVYQETEKTL